MVGPPGLEPGEPGGGGLLGQLSRAALIDADAPQRFATQSRMPHARYHRFSARFRVTRQE
jgi:hypothetical protein